MPATFQAINLENEASEEDQIETTRQLHLEEAIKRLQIALKLQAQGPAVLNATSEAYDSLFQCEIFRYPQATTEYTRSEKNPSDAVFDAPLTSSLNLGVSELDPVGSLTQALYYSFKNRGLFWLDRIRHLFTISGESVDKFYARDDVLTMASEALSDLNAALDQDPSDPDLWRKTARVASYLKSSRLKRYCLEAAIELDDDPTVFQVDPPSLAETLAGEQLRAQLELLADDVALSHPALFSWTRKRLPKLLRRHLDPIPFLPDPTRSLITTSASRQLPGPNVSVIDIPSVCWSEIGDALLTFASKNGSYSINVVIRYPTTIETTGTEALGQMEDVAIEIGRLDNQQSPAELLPDERSCDSVTNDATESQGNIKADDAHPVVPCDRHVPPSNRKRTQSDAGLQEDLEEANAVEKRSKRIRRREAANGDSLDSSAAAEQLLPLREADRHLFDITRSYWKDLGIDDRITFDRIDKILTTNQHDILEGFSTDASDDLRLAMTSYDKSMLKSLTSTKIDANVDLTPYLDHSKPGPDELSRVPVMDDDRGAELFLEGIAQRCLSCEHMAYEWLLALRSTYISRKWDDRLKTVIMGTVYRFHAELYRRVIHDIILSRDVPADNTSTLTNDLDQLVQMLLELHLDRYAEISRPRLPIENLAREECGHYLSQWLSLAVEISRQRLNEPPSHLSIRCLWVAINYALLRNPGSHDYIVYCWTQVKELLVGDLCGTISLPNSAVMPVLSPSVADWEISKLTALDFFAAVFQLSDPVAVIDHLEPLLNPSSVFVLQEPSNDVRSRSPPSSVDPNPIVSCASQGMKALWKTLSKSSTDFKVYLWSRLGDAYAQIEYKTKRLSCHLKAIEVIMTDLDSPAYAGIPTDQRKNRLIILLRFADDNLIPALGIAINGKSPFEVFDEEHIRSSAIALTKLSCLLHTAAVVDDHATIGLTPPLASSPDFFASINSLRDLQIRTWCMQYCLLKAGLIQRSDEPGIADTTLADYLESIHRVFGLRRWCSLSNKIFIKMMRLELLRFRNLDHWEDYMGPVLYDIHGLRLGVGTWSIQDHGCSVKKFDRRPALQLVERIVGFAKKMTMRDLLKSELKMTIEQIQQAIGQTKSTPQMTHNLRLVTELLKRPIHPLRLYRALTSGIGLDAIVMNTAESILARNDWYFLLGMIALTKFKGVDLNRRQSPGATDDLQLGAQFFTLQLQFTPEKWEAWFRLAECFDFELDEAVLWTADKMDGDRPELVRLQRHVINSYTLALSYSWMQEPSDGEAVYELYHNFAMRLYGSSRQPFAMEPFRHSDYERFFLEDTYVKTYKMIIHDEMTDLKVWRYSAQLFRLAMKGRPSIWKNPYMLAKCLWKMYNLPNEGLSRQEVSSKPSMNHILRFLGQAVKLAASVPKSRNGDPVLEPQYKMLSILHKLVCRDDIAISRAVVILSKQPFGVGIGEGKEICDISDWKEYVIKWLRLLRDKDKSNWHHRIIMRHATVLIEDGSDYDGDGSNVNAEHIAEAQASFNVLRESMFTKTMVMNVWKCDAERPGRHHVYTERYVRFVVKLLILLKDKLSLEMLLRRIRKKGADFYHFSELWQHCCMEYLRLLRDTGGIRPAAEDPFKQMSVDDFESGNARIALRASGPLRRTPAFECLIEAIDFKKLNTNLMRAAPIDDLISECYAALHFANDSGPPSPELRGVVLENTEGYSKDIIASQPETITAPRVPSSLLNILNPAPESTAGIELGHATTAAVIMVAPDIGIRPRKTGIRRTEVLRKAEQIVLQFMDTSKATGMNRTRLSSLGGKNGRTASVDAVPNEDHDVEMGEAGDGDDEEIKGTDMGISNEAPEKTNVEEVRGAQADDGISESANSAHDWADDESELSDAPAMSDDDEPTMFSFPNPALEDDLSRASGTQVGIVRATDNIEGAPIE